MSCQTNTQRLERVFVDPKVTRSAWFLAVLFYGIADVATTIYFVSQLGLVEQHPVAAAAIDSIGIWILAPWKAAAIGVFYTAYRVVPQPYSVGIPTGLALLGVVITANNTYLGLAVLGVF